MFEKSGVKWLGAAMAVLFALVGVAGCAQDLKRGSIDIVGSTSMQLLSEELAQAFMRKNPNVTVNIAGGGSGVGIKATQNGTADIGASSRELNPGEKRTVTETLIAKDGIIIVVHPGNPVKSLTLDQAKMIFAGEITNWKDVGGKDADINVFSREEGSGTRGAFEEIVMRSTKITAKTGVLNATGAVRTAVAGDPHGIGYISLGSTNQSVKALLVEGVKPSKETVLNGSYKIVRPFLYLTKGELTGPVKAYIDFVLSPEGQAIVGQEFVPVK